VQPAAWASSYIWYVAWKERWVWANGES